MVATRKINRHFASGKFDYLVHEAFEYLPLGIHAVYHIAVENDKIYIFRRAREQIGQALGVLMNIVDHRKFYLFR